MEIGYRFSDLHTPADLIFVGKVLTFKRNHNVNRLLPNVTLLSSNFFYTHVNGDCLVHCAMIFFSSFQSVNRKQ